MAIEREIMLKKLHNVKVLTFQEVCKIAENLEFDVTDKENCVKDCLSYLHRTGIVIYLATDDTTSKVVTDPTWLVRCFRLIITVKNANRSTTETSDMLERYEKTGEIPMKLVRLLLKQGNENDKFSAHEDVLVFYMERLELLTRPLTKDGQTVEDVFLVPCILPNAEPEKLRHIIENPKATKSSTLSFVFRDAFVSSPIYDKLLASCIHSFQVAEIQGMDPSYCLQRGFGCFRLNPRWNMIIHCDDNIVKVTLFTEKETTVNPGEGFHAKNVLASLLNNAFITNQLQHLVDSFEYCLDSSYYVIPGKLPLTVSRNTDHCDMVDPGWAVWFSTPIASAEDPVNLAMLKKRLNPKELSHVAKYIGADFCVLFTALGLTTQDMQAVQLSCPKVCHRSYVTRLLVKWRNRQGQGAIFEHILKAMQFAEFNTIELCEELDSLSTMYTPDDGECQLDMSVRLLTEREIRAVTKRIGLSFLIFFLELDLEIEEIECTTAEINGIRNITFALLSSWSTQSGVCSQLNRVYCAAKECDMDRVAMTEDLLRLRQDEMETG
ncbi:uncharacterized protein LOC132553354 [Ylistrum balloti]|uniref:uncharacterized protein LOC132553354 n=1 Tax=Ylistrum balloti TaxID=509963 RepID=UPI002905AE0E|nr:uncharacterized protein LOC132553354 [Ylistrum balloti]